MLMITLLEYCYVIHGTSKCTLAYWNFCETAVFCSLAMTLQQEALSNYLMQPFNAHVPYILQFYIEHDIFGMGMVHFDIANIRFRRLPSKSKKNHLMPWATLLSLWIELHVYL